MESMIEKIVNLHVGEQAVSNKAVEASTPAPTKDRLKDRRVRFAAVPTAEPTKQDQRAPIKMVSGRAWSPGIGSMTTGGESVYSPSHL